MAGVVSRALHSDPETVIPWRGAACAGRSDSLSSLLPQEDLAIVADLHSLTRPLATADPHAEPSAATGLDLRGLSKTYALGPHPVQAFAALDLGTVRGSFCALLGPPGSGRSSVLRIVAGLEAPTTGTVRVNGLGVPELQARHEIGVAFEDAALLPWRTVASNIRLPLEAAGVDAEPGLVGRLIRLAGLDGFERARPAQLSGGMRQRVALARSLVLDPSVLLLDEPFGALDAATRRQLDHELLRILAARPATTLLTTGEVAEAVLLADVVAVLGRQPGPLVDLVPIDLPRPRTRDVVRSPEFARYVDRLTAALAPGPQPGTGADR